MCGLCGILSTSPHFLEGGTDAARNDAVSSGRERRLERAARVRLINRVLAPYGCTIRDWTGAKYVVRSRSGKTALVDNLPQIWQALDKIAVRPVDPLDLALIADLKMAPPASSG